MKEEPQTETPDIEEAAPVANSFDRLVRNYSPVKQQLSDDCVRCAVASIFGLSAEQVPHFYKLGPWFPELQKWLSGYGWKVMIADEEETSNLIESDDECYMGNWMTDKAAHAVVMRSGEVLWNPSGAKIRTHHSNCVFIGPTN